MIDVTPPTFKYIDCPMILCLCEPFSGTYVENNTVKIGTLVNANFVVDHRYLDGAKAKPILESFKEVFDNPWKFN